MKKRTLTLALFSACLLAAQAQQQGGIRPEMLREIQSSYQETPSEKAIRNAIAGNDIRKLTLNLDEQKGIDTHFSIRVKSKGITDQQSSGRCWLFTGLNVMRAKAIAKYDLPRPGVFAGLFFLLGPAGEVKPFPARHPGHGGQAHDRPDRGVAL